ncbi:hypothetical protein T06_16514 [Trichinella sp. T6]|nr:hypothetical protein T06_16514 [Trichinella sp. T6]
MLKPARSASLSCGRLRYIRYPYAWNEGDFEIAMGIPEFEQLKILLINDRKGATWSLHVRLAEQELVTTNESTSHKPSQSIPRPPPISKPSMMLPK